MPIALRSFMLFMLPAPSRLAPPSRQPAVISAARDRAAKAPHRANRRRVMLPLAMANSLLVRSSERRLRALLPALDVLFKLAPELGDRVLHWPCRAVSETADR